MKKMLLILTMLGTPFAWGADLPANCVIPGLAAQIQVENGYMRQIGYDGLETEYTSYRQALQTAVALYVRNEKIEVIAGHGKYLAWSPEFLTDADAQDCLDAIIPLLKNWVNINT